MYNHFRTGRVGRRKIFQNEAVMTAAEPCEYVKHWTVRVTVANFRICNISP